MLQIKNINVIDVGEINALPGLIVNQEFEKGGFRIRMNALQILKRFLRSCGTGRRGNEDVGLARGA
ncbi:MAG: hypothetical protein AUH86_06465 [Acidobacteria bacterium 13_1_40CM_4_58_4]|nr:MAG: hypothetical protein AUH86_06465 [Acidobacteria bacterium 13_1_40CM_4_58_4]